MALVSLEIQRATMIKIGLVVQKSIGGETRGCNDAMFFFTAYRNQAEIG
jgi:hypothetical protein